MTGRQEWHAHPSGIIFFFPNIGIFHHFPNHKLFQAPIWCDLFRNLEVPEGNSSLSLGFPLGPDWYHD
ncbi:MAG: hypothetical protein ABFR75_13350 [Acidobacteriota bacterium]